MKKAYARPELLCEEYAPDTMIASSADNGFTFPEGAKNGAMDSTCFKKNSYLGEPSNHGNNGAVCGGSFL